MSRLVALTGDSRLLGGSSLEPQAIARQQRAKQETGKSIDAIGMVSKKSDKSSKIKGQLTKIYSPHQQKRSAVPKK
eukprot:CAMPEP_0170487064 /NCGR_PEP_ID=MMETSP0208-20121228/5932_1 /TAXON_ID=197538 /ORGANISM="Strombidium inclinatum, Strain S3" /LENGTH=75 /DNA_ID=CAMNT_0010761197 /DNA_START=1455 /DNA_END=1682 /DNA_ORIENTATION=+